MPSMISIIITSFKEPRTIGKAIEAFLNQNIKEKYELIITAPDKETLDIAKSYQEKYSTKTKNQKIKIFQDPGKGKSYAINLLLPKLKGEIIILSDGDVFTERDSVSRILKEFEDKKTGCVSGHPLSQNSRENIFGFWSHLLCFSVHKLRENRNSQNKFLECSGYLWAFRNNIIKKFPTGIAEDTIVPVLFWLKGYKIKYSPKSLVYVKFPSNLQDFLKQKRRAAASHETLYKYINPRKIPRMKTFLNEIAGSFLVFTFAKNLKEFFYTLLLFPIRLYIWLNLFFNAKFREKHYRDAWKTIKTTK